MSSSEFQAVCLGAAASSTCVSSRRECTSKVQRVDRLCGEALYVSNRYFSSPRVSISISRVDTTNIDLAIEPIFLWACLYNSVSLPCRFVWRLALSWKCQLSGCGLHVIFSSLYGPYTYPQLWAICCAHTRDLAKYIHVAVKNVHIWSFPDSSLVTNHVSKR